MLTWTHGVMQANTTLKGDRKNTRAPPKKEEEMKERKTGRKGGGRNQQQRPLDETHTLLSPVDKRNKIQGGRGTFDLQVVTQRLSPKCEQGRFAERNQNIAPPPSDLRKRTSEETAFARTTVAPTIPSSHHPTTHKPTEAPKCFERKTKGTEQHQNAKVDALSP